MNSELQKRLYEIEVIPPATVWEKLSVNIDEINADKSIVDKLTSSQITPPINAWENISAEITEKKKTTIINLRRLAAAAVFVAVIISAWLLFKNNKLSTELAGTEKSSQTRRTTADTNTVEKKSDNTGLNDLPSSSSFTTADQQTATPIRKNKTFETRTYHNVSSSQIATPQYAVLNNEIPLGKNFDRPIDDLSLVTADQNYLTMVNSNGRLVKIPAQLASLAPHLQDKPISEDFNEVMFGESAYWKETYWKETLNEWRKKVASSPVSSGDAFTSFIELLKTIQDK